MIKKIQKIWNVLIFFLTIFITTFMIVIFVIISFYFIINNSNKSFIWLLLVALSFITAAYLFIIFEKFKGYHF